MAKQVAGTAEVPEPVRLAEEDISCSCCNNSLARSLSPLSACAWPSAASILAIVPPRCRPFSYVSMARGEPPVCAYTARRDAQALQNDGPNSNNNRYCSLASSERTDT